MASLGSLIRGPCYARSLLAALRALHIFGFPIKWRKMNRPTLRNVSRLSQRQQAQTKQNKSGESGGAARLEKSAGGSLLGTVSSSATHGDNPAGAPPGGGPFCLAGGGRSQETSPGDGKIVQEKKCNASWMKWAGAIRCSGPSDEPVRAERQPAQRSRRRGARRGLLRRTWQGPAGGGVRPAEEARGDGRGGRPPWGAPRPPRRLRPLPRAGSFPSPAYAFSTLLHSAAMPSAH